MTDKRDFKSIIRDRQHKTGESYTAARVHVLRERNRLLGISDEPAATQVPIGVDAAVLEVGASTAWIRILDEEDPYPLHGPRSGATRGVMARSRRDAASSLGARSATSPGPAGS